MIVFIPGSSTFFQVIFLTWYTETGWDLGRFAGTWDPLLQCCSACTWTHLSSSNKIRRNCMGLKITACTRGWGKFWNQKIQRDQKNPTATFEGPGAKTGCWEQKQGTVQGPLHTAPPKGWAKHLSHPSSQTPGQTPSLTPYKEQACCPLRSRQARELVVCSRCPLLQQGPQ